MLQCPFRVYLAQIESFSLNSIKIYCFSQLKEENIFEIMNVADLLGVTSLNSACNAFLRRAITVHNCVSVYIMCKLHGYSDVAQEAVRHACRNFSRLMEIEEFLDMPFDMLVCCLEGKIVDVYSENGLLNVSNLGFILLLYGKSQRW